MLRGVLPIIPTPFTTADAVDEAGLRAVTEHAVASGAAAVVYPGVASEDLFLTPDERRAALGVVVRAAAGRLPVIAGVNRRDPAEMVAAADSALAAGADMAMAMATAEMADPEAGIAAIAEAMRGRPVILQNLGPPRGAGLCAQAMLDIARAVPNLRYVKEEGVPSGPVVSALVAGAGDALDGVIGGGGARYLMEELDRGVVATMPAIELLDLHVDLVRRHAAGDRTGAFALYERSVPLLLLQAPYRMRLTKLILKARGLIAHDGVREPLPEMDDVTRAFARELHARATAAPAHPAAPEMAHA
ncbi:MAG: dihydrodipicolinate synthase family protein [Paracoccaceae bacterium]